MDSNNRDRNDKYKISKEDKSIRSDLNREYFVDTLAVNINNDKLTDKEFREFVSNSILE